MADSAATKGYRGYITSRPFIGNRVPQHVQNIVIRDYCQRRGFRYLLSATEYAMPGCHMMLTEVLDELPSLDGIVAYSLFLLPDRREERHAAYRRVIEAGASLHGAVENFAIANWDDVARFEDIWALQSLVTQTTYQPELLGG
jgi:sporadic carbohydrate cluster protein (TIGR04323 family)